MKILAIETSCDDTGVALLDIEKDRIKILSDFVSSQVEIHAPYGGVVPNLAVRAHYKNLPILLEALFKKADPAKIDLVAVTVGPGLEPCLWAGVRTARMLAVAMQKPIVGVNHLEGHIAANWLKPIGGSTKSKSRNPKLPAICLIVSGGHSQLVLIRDMGRYKVIGQTRDDAAGEAFDKVAKLLGLGYPGGPKIALSAQNGTVDAFKLPRPMIYSPDYDFSFSGLKTAILYLMEDLSLSAARRQSSGDLTQPTFQVASQPLARPKKGYRIYNTKYLISNLCASFQQAVIDVLVDKTIRAAREYKAKTILLSGGVAANRELRKQMGQAIKNQLSGNVKYFAPNIKYCTDNAAMIGLAGYWKYKHDGADKIEKMVAKANANL
jgi:N6-L-threonylcarbamoyladenine synthase